MKELLSIFLDLFYFPVEIKSVPKYYFDNSISDEEKLKRDWEMIGKDFKMIKK